jgi:hypothetical protein
MQINLNIPTVYECEGIRLLPGSNEVDEGKAKAFLANKLVQADIDSGKLEVEKPKRGRPAKKDLPEVAPEPAPEA